MLKKSKLCIAAAICFVTFSNTIPVSASCSGWTTYVIASSSYCDTSDRCGFLWLKDTEKLNYAQERYCNVNGRQVREIRLQSTTLGCC